MREEEREAEKKKEKDRRVSKTWFEKRSEKEREFSRLIKLMNKIRLVF